MSSRHRVNMIFPKSPMILFYKSEEFSDYVQVICTESGAVFVDIRRYSNEKDLESRVCLREEEFLKLLPYFQKRKMKEFGSRRRIQFFELFTKEYMLSLFKPKNSLQTIRLNELELKNLLDKKEEIINFFDADVLE